MPQSPIADTDIFAAKRGSDVAMFTTTAKEIKDYVGGGAASTPYDPNRWAEFTIRAGANGSLKLRPLGPPFPLYVDKKDGSDLVVVQATRRNASAPAYWEITLSVTYPGIAEARTFRVYMPPQCELHEANRIDLTASSGQWVIAGTLAAYGSHVDPEPRLFTSWGIETALCSFIEVGDFDDVDMRLDTSACQFLSVGNMSKLTGLNLDRMPPNGQILIYGNNPELGFIELYDPPNPNFVNVHGIELMSGGTAPKLNAISRSLIGPLFHTLKVRGCAITANELNSILPAIASRSRMNNGVIDVSGGTSAVPADAAAAAITTLTGRGWTVTANTAT